METLYRVNSDGQNDLTTGAKDATVRPEINHAHSKTLIAKLRTWR
jgi:hypothetical protein